jgi:hypothetical protein
MSIYLPRHWASLSFSLTEIDQNLYCTLLDITVYSSGTLYAKQHQSLDLYWRKCSFSFFSRCWQCDDRFFMHFDSAQWGTVCFQAGSVFIDHDGSISTYITVPNTFMPNVKILIKTEPKGYLLRLVHNLFNPVILLHSPFRRKWVHLPHGLINYIDTKAKCRHQNILTWKWTLRKAFIRFYRLVIQ